MLLVGRSVGFFGTRRLRRHSEFVSSIRAPHSIYGTRDILPLKRQKGNGRSFLSDLTVADSRKEAPSRITKSPAAKKYPAADFFLTPRGPLEHGGQAPFPFLPARPGHLDRSCTLDAVSGTALGLLKNSTWGTRTVSGEVYHPSRHFFAETGFPIHKRGSPHPSSRVMYRFEIGLILPLP